MTKYNFQEDEGLCKNCICKTQRRCKYEMKMLFVYAVVMMSQLL
jgi:hypothetical protein